MSVLRRVVVLSSSLLLTGLVTAGSATAAPAPAGHPSAPIKCGVSFTVGTYGVFGYSLWRFNNCTPGNAFAWMRWRDGRVEPTDCVPPGVWTVGPGAALDQVWEGGPC